MAPSSSLTLGAVPLDDRQTEFLLWAPLAKRVDLHILTPTERLVPMSPRERGYWHTLTSAAPAGARYLYRLNGEAEWPDPASRAQPEGVHGASEVVDLRHLPPIMVWSGIPFSQYVVYELHVGTYSAEGTFDAVIPQLDVLKDLGVTAVEIMPVAQFPGERNWGYDGVYPFAPQASYGGTQGLARLVNACHSRGLAAILDVVYNHLGPEGNYLGLYGPYFTDRYQTPWGSAVNFDGPASDEVRRYFTENALHWFEAYGFDALRLDAIHGIRDFSARPFLALLAAATHRLSDRSGRPLHLIAESDLNDARVVLPDHLGGMAIDAQWSDDLHHALHVTLTGEHAGYYRDFQGVADLAKALRQGYVYDGRYAPSRERSHGNSPDRIRNDQIVVAAQTHDQVGNRMLGERLTALVDFDGLKLAAGTLILAPFIPLLFMGEEYGESAPFLYFTSHTDQSLIDAVRQGRRTELAAFEWQGEPPDPDDPLTFRRCRLDHQLRKSGSHRALWDFHRELIRLRREVEPLARLQRASVEVEARPTEGTILMRRVGRISDALVLLNYSPHAVSWPLPAQGRGWARLLDSAEERWLGMGSSAATEIDAEQETIEVAPRSFLVYLSRT